jgi:acetyltransferase-like isoleucine patch superfamily enzyme
VDWGGTLEIGDNVGISSCTIWAIDSITIGNRVIIGADSIIMDHNAHSLDYRERQNGGGERKHSPIIIGDDVFIGTRCIILKGVKIGARTIIGAGSVVTTDIPSDCIAAGNPCRIIKKIGTK